MASTRRLAAILAADVRTTAYSVIAVGGKRRGASRCVPHPVPDYSLEHFSLSQLSQLDATAYEQSMRLLPLRALFWHGACRFPAKQAPRPPRTRPATLTVRQPPPEPGGRLSWSRRCRLAPDGPRPHRDRRKWSGVRAGRDERVVQLDPGHAAGQISSESREFEPPR